MERADFFSRSRPLGSFDLSRQCQQDVIAAHRATLVTRNEYEALACALQTRVALAQDKEEKSGVFARSHRELAEARARHINARFGTGNMFDFRLDREQRERVQALKSIGYDMLNIDDGLDRMIWCVQCSRAHASPLSQAHGLLTRGNGDEWGYWCSRFMSAVNMVWAPEFSPYHDEASQ